MWWHDRDELALNLVSRDVSIDIPAGASESMSAEPVTPEWFCEIESGANAEAEIAPLPYLSAEAPSENAASAAICTPPEEIEPAASNPAGNAICRICGPTALALYDPNLGKAALMIQPVAEAVATVGAVVAADPELLSSDIFVPEIAIQETPTQEIAIQEIVASEMAIQVHAVQGADVPEANFPEMSVQEVAEAVQDALPDMLPIAAGPAPDSSPLAAPPDEPISASLLTFYGLSEQPFQVTPDPAYLYLSDVHREALTSLSQGVRDLRGFMTLIAEPGMGKTTLLNKLMEELRDSARIVFLFQTQCNSRELLRYLLGELGVESSGMDVVAMHRKLNEQLFQEMLQGRRFVLIVDEAQNLQDSVLETIRLLSDFETAHRKLIQIVLAGQPQLVDTLMRPGLSQLRQRIAILASLAPLSAAETARYVEHRLRAAGLSGELMFTEDALAVLAERSKGTPRSINNLCFNALQLGYTEGSTTIGAAMIEKVAGKLDLESLRRPQPEPAPVLAAQPAAPAALDISSQLASVLLAALTREAPSHRAGSSEPQPRASATLTGKVTEKVKSRSWSQDREYRIQVSLGREASSEIPVADRYYCCSFYIDEEQAAGLQAGQPIRIKFEQD